MYQNCASFSDGLVNEITRGGEVDDKILVVNIRYRNPQLPNPTSRNVSWDRVRADGHNVSDPSLGYGSRSTSGDQTIEKSQDMC